VFEAIGNAAADILGQLLHPFIRATIRMVRYAFSPRYRLEIDGKYRARNQWSNWWYLARGTLPLLLLVLGAATLLLWPRTMPAEQPKHHHILQGAEELGRAISHKLHPQD
jgi:hypothetical protein